MSDDQWQFFDPKSYQQPMANSLVDAGRLKRFHVVTCISNPILYQSRYRLYRQFEKYMKDSGATLTTVELATGARPFAVTEANNPRHVQLRTVDDMWHKENMLDIGVAHLSKRPETSDWEYVAFIDADVAFLDPNWFINTWQLLQRYHVIQMFEQAQDLTPTFNMFQKHTGFVSCYIKSGYQMPTSKAYESWHPGFAWAMSREAYKNLGGLVDFSILGAGDRHMALGFIGAMQEGDQAIPTEMSAGFKQRLFQWQDRAVRYLRKDIGFLPGTIVHYFHGKKVNRGYKTRWKVLIDNKYDPNTDIKYDEHGVLQIVDEDSRQIRLRDEIRAYFSARNEDDISVG